MRCFPAFTLIELLVVITIIVVLLALLTPALDSAIYQAELAVCGTRLHGIANGAQTYAVAHKRFYPNRAAAIWPQQLSYSYTGDDRPMLRDYISINDALLCPLSPAEVDIGSERPDFANRRVNAYSSYVLWFGFSYTITGVQAKSMKKLGDLWTYESPQVSVTSDLLAMDTDVTDETNGYAFASHPDADGVLANWSMDNVPYEPGLTSGRVNYAFSWWLETGGLTRGLIDNTYIHGDGSVERIVDVKFLDNEKDMVQLPVYRNGSTAWRIQTPTR